MPKAPDVVITVVSTGDEAPDRHLRTFLPNPDCSFAPLGLERGGYYYHGCFLLPLTKAAVADDEVAALAALSPTLRTIRDHLRASTLTG